MWLLCVSYIKKICWILTSTAFEQQQRYKDSLRSGPKMKQAQLFGSTSNEAKNISISTAGYDAVAQNQSNAHKPCRQRSCDTGWSRSLGCWRSVVFRLFSYSQRRLVLGLSLFSWNRNNARLSSAHHILQDYCYNTIKELQAKLLLLACAICRAKSN